jgi:hypothetical protein
MITKPQLPPKAGYVEVEVDGVRTYKNVVTGILIDNEVETPDLQADMAELLIDLAYRITPLELGVSI